MADENKIELTEEEINDVVSSIQNAPVDGYGSISKNKAIYTVPFKKLADKLKAKSEEAFKKAKEENARTYIDATEKGLYNGVATLDENAKIPTEQIPDLEKVSKAGDEMTGPLRVSSVQSSEKSQLQNNGVEVGILDAEEPAKTWYANGFILRTKEGKNVYIALPDKDGTLITADDVATVRETAEDALSIAKGANQSLSYGDYATLISTLNALPKNALNVGQNLYIFTVGVPDLWVAEIVEEAVEYAYTTDEDFVNALKENDFVQVGHYKIAQLETQEAVMTNCVKFTDYAGATAGVIKSSKLYGLVVSQSTGLVNADILTADEYSKTYPGTFIGKGTLEVAKYDIVKRAITENDITLTDEEKAAALAWLGALPIVAETSGFQKVYGIQSNGKQTTFVVDATLNGAQQGRIPVRGTNGKIYIKTASIDEDEVAVNRKYVDDGLTKKRERISATGLMRIYITDSNGNDGEAIIGSSVGASYPERIPKYWSNDETGIPSGVLITGTPKQAGHAANKEYVDNVKGTKLYLHTLHCPICCDDLLAIMTDNTPLTTVEEIFNAFHSERMVKLYGKLNYPYEGVIGVTNVIAIIPVLDSKSNPTGAINLKYVHNQYGTLSGLEIGINIFTNFTDTISEV